MPARAGALDRGEGGRCADAAEPWAVNTVVVGETVVVLASFPRAAARLVAAGFTVSSVDTTGCRKVAGSLGCARALDRRTRNRSRGGSPGPEGASLRFPIR